MPEEKEKRSLDTMTDERAELAKSKQNRPADKGNTIYGKSPNVIVTETRLLFRVYPFYIFIKLA